MIFLKKYILFEAKVSKIQEYSHKLIDAVADVDLTRVKYLIENGADVNYIDADDETPLLFACGIDDVDIIKYLIEKGADVDYKSEYGDGITPIVRASMWDYLENVKILIDNGADPETRSDRSGRDFIETAPEGGIIEDWLSEYSVQKKLITNHHKLFFSFKNRGIIDKKIYNEFKFIESATDLNLFD